MQMQSHKTATIFSVWVGVGSDYKIEIPTELPASILDGYGKIAHPNGLYWYHSHLHGISAGRSAGACRGYCRLVRATTT